VYLKLNILSLAEAVVELATAVVVELVDFAQELDLLLYQETPIQ
jgi:hypothetical protein